ncbi:MAG: two-component regulator propeller domain-containing protein [Breznakibacter sp.]
MNRFVVIMLLVMVWQVAFPQQSMVVHRRYTSDDGLSHSWIRCIYQDEFGFLWIGTKDGLNRFDGIGFEPFLGVDDEANGLHNNTILDLRPYGVHQMFICTGSGAYLFNYVDGKFSKIDALPNYEVYTVVTDKRGDFWFGTSNGVYCLDKSLNATKHYSTRNTNTTLSNDIVSALFIDTYDRLWVGTINGLNIIDLVTEKNDVYYALGKRKLPSGSAISKFLSDSAGNIFIGVAGYGVDYCRAEDLEKPRLLFSHLIGGSAIDMLIDRDSCLWIANTRSFGVFQLKLNKDFSYSKNVYMHDLGNTYTITSNNTDCLFEDKWGDIWIGTYMQGLNHLSNRCPRFRNVRYNQFDKQTLLSSVVNAFWDDGDYVWVGTERGINKFDKRSEKIVSVNGRSKEQQHFLANSVYTFYKDGKGRLWAGTWAGGLIMYDGRNGQFTNYLNDPSDASSIPSNNVYCVTEGSDGRLWLGLIRGKLGWFEPERNRFHEIDDPTGKVNTSNVCEMTGEGNRFWLSTYNNAVLFDPANNTFESFPALRRGGDLVEIFRDSNGNMWFGSESGLVGLSADGATTHVYSETDGLVSNSIKSIEEDATQNLWISTNKGLSKFVGGAKMPKAPFFKNFNVSDGLQGSEFNIRSSCKTREGYLFFGGVNGFTYFDPDSTKENTLVPPVYITGVRTVNDSLSGPSKNVYLGDTLYLRYDRNSFTIHFAALNYLTSTQNKYRYKLYNWDKKWVDAGGRKYVTYSNVAPGKYVFKVMACNNDGYWNDKPAQMTIVVMPPWWLALWFKLTLAILAILLVGAIYRMRVRHLTRQKLELALKVGLRTTELSEANKLLAQKQHKITLQNEELELHRINLEQLVAKRTSELEQAVKKAEDADKLKSSFLANMSHEIRTPMNAIVGFSSLLAEEIQDKELLDYVNVINNNCQSLLVLINDIIDLSMIEADHLKIIPTTIQLTALLEEIERQFRYVKSEVPIVLVRPAQDIASRLDGIRLKQIIANLLDNAIKYTHQGEIRFGYREYDESTLCFYVADTGIGIAPDKLDFLFTPFGKIDAHNNKIYRGTGLGLSICHRLVELMGGQIWVESKINEGTTFFFTMPVNR